jgi:hypothetical protein
MMRPDLQAPKWQNGVKEAGYGAKRTNRQAGVQQEWSRLGDSHW